MSKDCWPSPCQCCVCQKKMCMFYHPGHDHSIKEKPKDYITDRDLGDENEQRTGDDIV